MTICQHCKRPNELYLCQECQDQLANMLADLPWLLDELDARIQRLDRISIGTIGRNRRPDELNVMDFDAAETARNAHKAIRDIVTTINGPGTIRLQCTVQHDFIGPLRPAWRRLPAGYRPRIIELIDWLMRRVDTIARHQKAGHVYRELARLVGDNQRGGELVTAINPTQKHAAGPCPTITGRNHNGTPRQCATMLFADTYDRTTTCPTCQQTINVEDNRRKAAADRDLHTRADMTEVLSNIDEPVTEDQLQRWITARRLRPQGWKHDGVIVQFQINENDEPVYSLERARKLRRRDNNLRTRQRTRATHA